MLAVHRLAVRYERVQQRTDDKLERLTQAVESQTRQQAAHSDRLASQEIRLARIEWRDELIQQLRRDGWKPSKDQPPTAVVAQHHQQHP
jgi:hypothetical protein